MRKIVYTYVHNIMQEQKRYDVMSNRQYNWLQMVRARYRCLSENSTKYIQMLDLPNIETKFNETLVFYFI